MTSRSPNFITTADLADNLSASDLVVVDGSWHLPAAGRDGRREYLAGHVPGAVFFDIDAIADRSSGLPHMLPSPEAFADAVGALGIARDMRVVVYDCSGLFSAPRVWWTFKTFGVADVRLLDGGLPLWRAEGRPLESGTVTRPQRRFTPLFARENVADITQVQAAVESGSAQVLDARPADRFAGWAPEPRPGVRPGHMPGSRNLPFSEILTDGRLQPAAALRDAFAGAGIDLQKPVITSCGSGVSAAILTLALDEIGTEAKLYDGSWAEWGSRSDLSTATRPKP